MKVLLRLHIYALFPFYYKALSEGLDRSLGAEDAWYPCLYDGDGCLG
jgi:hypothetical protein